VGAAVTRAGYAVLRSLSDNDESSVRDVARAAVMDAATASRQVNQLVEDGLVLRRAADTDARAVTLSLTERGRAVYERIVRYRLNHLATVLGEWTAAERSTLAALVNRFTADLAAAEDPDMAGFERDRR
jgi:DNA-binding MarR family transcriptional regulator